MVEALFWIFLVLSCAYGVAFGGVEGRRVTVIYVVGSLLTIPAQRVDVSWQHAQLPVAIVDTAVFVALFAIAARSRHYWPIWMTGFQLNTVAAHVAAMLAPSFLPRIYFAMASMWFIPALFFMVIGITMDRRARQLA